ncbi:unnamed protein product [Pleuronectes platessa]|uniref:Uncharacterized protein n=1 Tax=Pleuronectes platessa TaxID=8262 RepID=A0A9N7YTG0_PLEPL|nr:unnamed protein product [Pleuronectes platessa]
MIRAQGKSFAMLPFAEVKGRGYKAVICVYFPSVFDTQCEVVWVYGDPLDVSCNPEGRCLTLVELVALAFHRSCLYTELQSSRKRQGISTDSGFHVRIAAAAAPPWRPVFVGKVQHAENARHSMHHYLTCDVGKSGDGWCVGTEQVTQSRWYAPKIVVECGSHAEWLRLALTAGTASFFFFSFGAVQRRNEPISP